MDLSALEEKAEIKYELPATAETPTIDAEKAASTESTNKNSATPAFIRKYKGWSWLAVCVAVYSSAFLYWLDTTIVADIQSFAAEEFGSIEKLGWLGIGFPLGSVATILSFSKAYCMFDVKW